MQPQTPKDIAREAIREALTTYMRESGRVPTGIDFDLVETTCIEDVSSRYVINTLSISDRERTQTRTAQDCLNEVEIEIQRIGMKVPEGPDVSPGIAWFNADGRRTDWLWIETEANAVQLVTPGAETGFVIIWPNVPLPATESHAWKHDGAELKITYTRYSREESNAPSLYGDIEVYYRPSAQTFKARFDPLSKSAVERVGRVVSENIKYMGVRQRSPVLRESAEEIHGTYTYCFHAVLGVPPGMKRSCLFKSDLFHPNFFGVFFGEKDPRNYSVDIHLEESLDPFSFFKRIFRRDIENYKAKITIKLQKNSTDI